MTRKEFTRSERAADQTVAEILQTVDYLNRLNGPERSRRERRKRMRKCFARIELLIEWLLLASYIETYLREYNSLRASVPWIISGPPRKIPGPEIRKRIITRIRGKTFRERLRKHEADYLDRTEAIRRAEEDGILKRSDAETLLRGTTGPEGIGGLGYKLSTLARTENAAAVNKAAVLAMKDAGVEFYKVKAILDDRTCTGCWEINDKIFPVSEAKVGVNFPPFHPNCRCYIEAVV